MKSGTGKDSAVFCRALNKMLIINARIHTVENGIIENGYIKISGGKIAEVNEMPGGLSGESEIYDAAGAAVFPGFIDAHCHLGMWEDSLGFEGDDGNEDTDPCTPHLRAIDAVNPLDRCFSEALAAGITAVMTGPGSANPVAGQNIVMKTYGRRIDDMIINPGAGIKFALGENPKTTYNGKNQSPSTRMATAALIREQLYKARRYLHETQESELDSEISPPEYDIKCEALLPLLRGECGAFLHAHRSDDIFTALRIVREFGIKKYAVIHCTEGYKIADILASEPGMTVLCGPVICDRSKPELSGLNPACAGILHKAGIKTAIITDHPETPVQYLPVCAGLAVREGMDYGDAIRSITLTPAEICGISDRAGSITPGKDADLVIFRGDPLSIMSKPEAVIAGGEMVRAK